VVAEKKMPLLKKLFRPVFLVLIFFLSAGLISYTWWLFQIERGNRALRRGESLSAAEIYQSAEAFLGRVPWLATLFRSDYQKLIFNQVGILYALGRDDEVMDKLDQGTGRAPFLAESGEYSFWTGNVLLRRAVQAKDPEDSLEALKGALSEYQKGLAAEPDDWDLKYNYELVRHILSQKELDKKKEGERVKSILEKMRPTVEPSRQELPPEKRG
jgi:tetratricopeptide (TPR) repeat protein